MEKLYRREFFLVGNGEKAIVFMASALTVYNLCFLEINYCIICFLKKVRVFLGADPYMGYFVV